MARAPSALWRREDYPDLQGQDQLDRFFRQLNTFAAQTTAALSKGLTLADNSRAFVKTVTIATADEWTAPALTNSWANCGGDPSPAGYMKRDGWVILRGAIKSGTLGAAAFTLPAGYRPAYDVNAPAIGSSDVPALLGWASVHKDGSVIPGINSTGGNAWFTLDGIMFRAADPSPVPLIGAVSIKNDLGARPIGVLVIGAQDVTNKQAVPVALGGVAWTTTADQVLVSDIQGLMPSRKYQVALLVIGG